MKLFRVAGSCALAVAALASSVWASNEIQVDPRKELGAVNPLVFGHNLLGHRSEWEPENRYSDFGAGFWDPLSGKPVDEALRLAEGANIRALRFPGGGGANHYDWRSAVDEGRKEFLFGLNEFLSVCRTLKAEPIFTMAYFTGDDNGLAELAETLSRRGVRYFEVGNETYWGDKPNGVTVTPEDYGRRFVRIREAVKAAVPDAQLGVVLSARAWNEKVLAVVGPHADFGILHIYPTPVWGEKLETMDPLEIFADALAKPVTEEEPHLRETAALLEKLSGRKVPIAVTEYNGGFAQQKPVPYRHAMGTALVNAELLRIFMKPENGVLMANHWNFSNEYWGMVANGFNGDPEDLHKPYFKRPNYHVFEMYGKHFGETLVQADALVEYYESGRRRKQVAYLSVNASTDGERAKAYLMVVNKNLERSVTASVRVKGTKPDSEVSAWVLNGPSVSATNEDGRGTVDVKHHKFQIGGDPFEFTFEPHSLTALEIPLNGNSP